MVYYIKKTSIFLVCIIIILLTLILKEQNSVPVNSSIKKIIVLDAGHGEPDGGAVGKSGTKESVINLAVTKVVEAELEKAGYTVIMTRSDEKAIYTKEEDSVRNKKRSDLSERARIANESGAAILISIHMNSYVVEKYSGPQVFYALGSTEGKRAAEKIRESFLKNIGDHCTREIKEVNDGIYLLKNTKIPAVLVECGFLSNNAEEALLITKAYQEKMGKAVADGILSYFEDKAVKIG